ncbi:hypothetical protein K504DRAFT_13453 [Pleomassaria siparia CBS 279.74]|uniref:Uncharacterized protein n=1 Tax=Pleomassaria siparia CBS 279.74 TaxID=1314801 RepID=A0A6G1KQQ8_9PLEO|nr:hypothetical protein K504DRAFT_13453 [Pleomassaria siparia CBS 279.74]
MSTTASASDLARSTITSAEPKTIQSNGKAVLQKIDSNIKKRKIQVGPIGPGKSSSQIPAAIAKMLAPSTSASGTNVKSMIPTKRQKSTGYSVKNPIDVDALHPVLVTPGLPPFKVKKTPPNSTTLPGPGNMANKSTSAESRQALHGAAITRPMPVTTSQTMQDNAYQAAEQNMQNVYALMAQQRNGVKKHQHTTASGYQMIMNPPRSASVNAVNPRPRAVPRSALAPINYANSKYHQHNSAPAPTKPASSHTKFHPIAEEELRKRVVQYVRDYSRPGFHKRRILVDDDDDDPEATSGDENDESSSSGNPHNVVVSSSGVGMSNAVGSTNFAIANLTSHTRLLTDLFQIYPHSRDQAGLREDIAMLVSVQNQRLRDWLRAENKENARKRPKLDVTRDTTTIPSFSTVEMECATVMRRGSRDKTDTQEDRHGKQQAKKQTMTELEVQVLKFLPSDSEVWNEKDGVGPKET